MWQEGNRFPPSSLSDLFIMFNNVFHCSVDKNLFVNFLYLTPTLNGVKQHQPFSPHPPRLKMSQRQLGYSGRDCDPTTDHFFFIVFPVPVDTNNVFSSANARRQIQAISNILFTSFFFFFLRE